MVFNSLLKSMVETFYDISLEKEAITDKDAYSPILERVNGAPIVSLYETFSGCTKLKVAPDIPDTVTDMDFAFYGCENLIVAPKIPDGVVDMSWGFYGCTSLVSAPEIPRKVINIGYAFWNCISLRGEVKINIEETDYYEDCLSGCSHNGRCVV